MRRERNVPPIRVLVVSDQDVIRAGLVAVLVPYRARVTVTGQVAKLADAMAPHARSTADVVLFDARLAGGNGLDAVDQLAEAWGDRRVVVLASPDEVRFAQPVLQRGAAGFLFVTIAGEELAEQIERVRDDAIVLDASLAGGRTQPGDGGPAALWPGCQLGLTEPQSRVLELVAHGDRTATVADRLDMSEVEVKSHLRSAYRRLDVRDRPHALARLADFGVFR